MNDDLAPEPSLRSPRATASEDGARSLPQDARAVLLGGIFVLRALYLTSEIVIPLAFAILLKLLLQPGVRQLQRFSVPQTPGAIVMILLLFHVLYSLVFWNWCRASGVCCSPSPC